VISIDNDESAIFQKEVTVSKQIQHQESESEEEGQQSWFQKKMHWIEEKIQLTTDET
jgi:hypothetical protein